MPQCNHVDALRQPCSNSAPGWVSTYAGTDLAWIPWQRWRIASSKQLLRNFCGLYADAGFSNAQDIMFTQHIYLNITVQTLNVVAVTSVSILLAAELWSTSEGPTDSIFPAFMISSKPDLPAPAFSQVTPQGANHCDHMPLLLDPCTPACRLREKECCHSGRRQRRLSWLHCGIASTMWGAQWPRTTSQPSGQTFRSAAGGCCVASLHQKLRGTMDEISFKIAEIASFLEPEENNHGIMLLQCRRSGRRLQSSPPAVQVTLSSHVVRASLHTPRTHPF